MRETFINSHLGARFVLCNVSTESETILQYYNITIHNIIDLAASGGKELTRIHGTSGSGRFPCVRLAQALVPQALR